MAQYDKLINLGLLSQFLTKAKTIFAPKITASGILKGDGQGGVTAATAGTDYATPGLGLTGAKVGDLVRVNAVDSNGKPTSWKHVPLNEIKCNKNLLDNWYFVGGGSQLGDGVFPINQRGQTSYTANGYTIDRWTKAGNTSLELGANGVKYTRTIASSFPTFTQKITGVKAGMTVTLSALARSHLEAAGNFIMFRLMNSSGSSIPALSISIDQSYSDFELITGQLTCIEDIAEVRFQFSNPSETSSVGDWVEIAAVKLELGSEQTLAHNEGTEANPVWVLNEIPDYGEELRKCQRYQLVLTTRGGSRADVGIGSANNNYGVFLVVPTPVTLYKTPTIQCDSCNLYNYVSGGSAPLSNIGVIGSSENSVFISGNSPDLTQFAPYTIRIQSNGKIILDANL